MERNSIDISQRQIALVAGVAFLIMTIAALFAILFVFEKMRVGGDSSATANNIIASEMLFRAGFCSLILVIICDVVVSWALYLFLKQVNKDISLLAMLFRLVYAAIFGSALVNLAIALNCMKDKSNLAALGSNNQLHAQVQLFFNTFFDGWAVGLIVFGFHLLVLGYLVFKSGYIPKVIGILISFGAMCYIMQNIAVFILPNYGSYKATFEMIFGIPMAIGELSLAFWLLFKGGKHQEGNNRSAEVKPG